MKRSLVLTFVLTTFVFAAGYAAEPAPLKPLPWLGMGIRFERNSASQKYLFVDHIAPLGPADRAGIKPGDLITRFGGAATLEIGDELDFLMFISHRKPGERVLITRVRNGESKEATIIVGLMPLATRAAWERGLQVARRNRLANQIKQAR